MEPIGTLTPQPDALRRALRGRALRLLAQREHSRPELASKLQAALRHLAPEDVEIPDASVVDHVLDDLEARGWLSDARFIESRVRQRQGRFGVRRIQDELQRHGVSLDASSRQTLDATEFERAQSVWQRKYGGAPRPDDLRERTRQMRFLMQRGFSHDTIRRVLSAARPSAANEANLGDLPEPDQGP